VWLINRFVWALYGQALTDEATCYKAMRMSLIRRMDLRSERFELCAEMTAKAMRLGVKIVEVPITYRPRGKKEGKKIGWKDACATFLTLAKWRFARIDSPTAPVLTFGPLVVAHPAIPVLAFGPLVVAHPAIPGESS